MSYSIVDTIAYSGESNDAQTERLDTYLSGTTSNTVSTLFAQTGSRCEALDLSTNGNRAILLAGTLSVQGGIYAISMGVAVSTAPTSELGLVTGATATSGPSVGTASTRSYVRIGTDRKLYLYDKAGSPIVGGVSTSLVPTSGSMLEVAIFYDGLTNPINTWIKMYVNGVEELAFATGQPIGNIFSSLDYLFFGESLAAGTNRGCTPYVDDALITYSAVANDAPHITAYPRIRVAGCMTADAQGTLNGWTPTPAGADHYNRITTNDGDTNNLQDAIAGTRDSWKSSTANPLPVGATVLKAQLRWVGKLAGVGKTPAVPIYGVPGSTQTQTTGALPSGTTYQSAIAPRIVASGGAIPVRADFDANAYEWGTTHSTSQSNTITFSPGPEIVYYTATLPLGTAPSSPTVVDTSSVGTDTDATVV